MLSQITIAGRPTKDPTMQTSKDGTKYITLDIANTQGFGDNAHSLFFSCYFNAYLAERLVKAKVAKATCLDITGKFDSKEFTRRDGTPGRSLEIRVQDWEFSISNKADSQNMAPTNVSPGTQAPTNAPVGQAPPASVNQTPGYNPGAAPYPQGTMPPANNGYMQPAGQNYAPPAQNTQPPQQPADGFTSVPQAYANQLPFPA